MKKKHPEHVNHERWLVSYADFITLLFAFFVVLFASGQSDKRKTLKLAQAMQSAFQYNGIFDQHAKTPPLNDDPTPLPTAVPAPIMLPVPAPVEAEKITPSNSKGDDRINLEKQFERAQLGQAHAKGEIENFIQKQVALKQITQLAIAVHESDQGLVVSLREAGFFNSGSAEIRPEALDTFRQVASLLPHQPMRVEGHTDDIPIHSAQYASNWELSTARAATVTRLLISDYAVDPTQVSAVGYAEFHPVASNANEAGRQLNRRVDIVLLKPVAPPPSSQPADATPRAPNPRPQAP
jgi:chemotaxis protein MotB